MISQTEVYYFYILYISQLVSHQPLLLLEHHHYILRFQVSVNDLKWMKVEHRLNNSTNDKCRYVLWQSSSLPHILIQISAIDILSYNINMLFASHCGVILDYLRMLENFHDLALVVKSLLLFCCQFLGWDVLQSEYSSIFLVSATINNWKFTCPYWLMDIV